MKKERINTKCVVCGKPSDVAVQQYGDFQYDQTWVFLCQTHRDIAEKILTGDHKHKIAMELKEFIRRVKRYEQRKNK